MNNSKKTFLISCRGTRKGVTNAKGNNLSAVCFEEWLQR